MRISKDKSQVVLTIVASMLLVTNLLLVFQNLDLRSKLKKFEPIEVEVGDVFEPFQAKSLNGNVTSINYDENDSKKILLFFKTTCGYSQKQMSYWKDLAKDIDSQKYKIIAITIEDNTQTLKDYLRENKIENWEVLSIKPEDAQKAKLLATPVTVVLNSKGIVEKAWKGMWQEKEVADASDYFAIHFTKVKMEINQ